MLNHQLCCALLYEKAAQTTTAINTSEWASDEIEIKNSLLTDLRLARGEVLKVSNSSVLSNLCAVENF